MLEGIFLQESKNRFLCEVEIENGIKKECYVPCSCRLSNFVDFGGCSVLLTETMKKDARTQYALYAVRYKRNHVLLNLKETNNVIAEGLRSRRFSFLGDRSVIFREYCFDDYRCDLFLPKTDTVIEIKSILSFEKCQKVTVVHSKRALRQLMTIKSLLQNGYKVYYFFVALNPKTKCLHLENDNSDYAKLIMENIKLGMICKAYSIRIEEKRAVINSEIELKMD